MTLSLLLVTLFILLVVSLFSEPKLFFTEEECYESRVCSDLKTSKFSCSISGLVVRIVAISWSQRFSLSIEEIG